MFGFCDEHKEQHQWVELAEGRRKFTCKSCLTVEREYKGQEFPMVKYGQQWGRDRPLTKEERKRPPRRPT